MTQHTINMIIKGSVVAFTVGVAGYICANGLSGWGWFLVVALLVAS